MREEPNVCALPCLEQKGRGVTVLRKGGRLLGAVVCLLLLLADEARGAEFAVEVPRSVGASAMSPLFAQTARRRPKAASPDAGGEFAGVPTWAWVMVGSVLVLALGGAVTLTFLQRKKKKTTEGDGSPDMIGRYRLLNLLMTGQTSQVWEAMDPSSGLHFAIKLLLPEFANSKEHRDFLFHEAEIGMLLSHPNVIKVVSVSKDKTHPHFVMDFFPGGSLKQRIIHKQQDFIKEKAQDILKQTATALAFMNAQGWVHRDIKPDNVLVNSAGEAKVIDFAITQRVSTGAAARMLKTKGPIQGTRSYMSPEQIRNEGLDGRADIYSFGAMCYELVTGRPPFRAGNPQDLLNKHLFEKPVTPRSHNPQVTEDFADLVLKMLEKKKEDRPANFHEILMKLRKIKVFRVEQAKKSGAPQEGR